MKALIYLVTFLLALHVLGLKVSIDIDGANSRSTTAVEQSAPQSQDSEDDRETDGETEQQRNSI